MKNWLKKWLLPQADDARISESLMHAAAIYGIAFDKRECENFMSQR